VRRPGAIERTLGLAGILMLGLGLGLGTGGCGLLFEDPDAPAPRSTDDEAAVPAMPGDPADGGDLGDPDDPAVRAALAEAGGLPAGLGTLRQEQIAIRVRRGELEMFVVPLHEGVTRTTAPDTWERLSALALSHRRWFRERTGSDAPYRLFLVALFTEAEPLAFEADELTLVSGGLRLRHVMVRGLTPGWDQQRLQPGESQMAVYAFPPEVVLSGDLEVEYREVRSRDWSRILPVVEAERRRVLARAGGTP
jgi:hypothetical protein